MSVGVRAAKFVKHCQVFFDLVGIAVEKLPFIDRSKYAAASGLARGAYVLADAPGGAPQVVLMSSGSEVSLILEPTGPRLTTESQGALTLL